MGFMLLKNRRFAKIAFIDSINEVAIKQNKWYKDLSECCSEDLLRIMIADLDKDKDIPLERYTIPKCIGYHFEEIMDTGRIIQL